MLKVVKVRLYPNKEQQQLIHKTFGSCRFVYNILLDAKIKAYECGDSLSAYELKKRLVPMKQVQGGEFLKEVDSTALQNSVLKIDIAYKNFFRRVKLGEKAGFPRFKSKHNSYQSYQTSTASIKDNKLYLPKIGEVKAKFHRGKIIGKIKTVTVSYEAGQYHASIILEYKLKRNGGELIKVDPKYTSQKCSCCGHISKENIQTQAKFICTKCNTTLNADYNASVNILNAVGTTAKAS